MIRFHEWLLGGWGILFSHPADYTPVCTTELGRVQELHGEFEKRGCKVIALSIDTVKCHQTWIEDVKVQSCQMAKFYPFISLNCPRLEGGAQSKERKGSNFAV